MSDRHTAGTITSDALDQLYEQLEARRTIIRSNITKFRSWAHRIRDLEAHATDLEQRAERAEAANQRVRDIPLEPVTADEPTTSWDHGYNQALRAARAALDQQQPTTTEA
ncbi:hypothetical protein ACFYPA_06360 [Streptomyces sp. NPDC005775]|uniref:hypothetical protein n=1 Tax=Streptomyces sp. NPDC005775 TaxID=3364729 RepID=UPI00369EE34A